MARTLSRIVQVLKDQSSATGNVAWFKKLKPADAANLASVRDAFVAGELRHLSIVDIHRTVCNQLGISVRVEAFRRYLQGESSAEAN